MKVVLKIYNYIKYFYLLFFKFKSLFYFDELIKNLKNSNHRKTKKNEKKIILLDGIWENYVHLFRILIVFLALKEDNYCIAIIKKKNIFIYKIFF